uniref:Uncharacterized protein n=1 Tax=viral metagenome TaxID=1070528 RepID=A0A6M3IY06_9ZZZZ
MNGARATTSGVDVVLNAAAAALLPPYTRHVLVVAGEAGWVRLLRCAQNALGAVAVRRSKSGTAFVDASLYIADIVQHMRDTSDFAVTQLPNGVEITLDEDHAA